MLARLQVIAEAGPPRNVEICHRIETDIWQLEAGRIRVLWFYDEDRVVICSHGFMKASQRTPESEKRIAREALSEAMSTPEPFEDLFSEAAQSDEYWTELAILEFTEELARWMTVRKMSRADLARAIGSSQPYVTKALRGNVNFTIGSMVKLSRAMKLRIRMHLAPEESHTLWRPWDVLAGEVSLDLPGILKTGIEADVTSEARANTLTIAKWSVKAA